MNMNSKIWSSYVQRAETLYKSRSVRFRDEYRENVINGVGLKDGMSILEIGCGPGLLCHRLKEWLPGCCVTGLDRDESFVEYARHKSIEKGLDCSFATGDALSLPFADNTFDACTSHTVIEHVPNITFLAEQYRVCKPGGVVSVMSSRTEAAINPENWFPPSGEERALLDMAETVSTDCLKNNNVGQYSCTAAEIPRYMEKAGFTDVSVDFIAVTLVPDNAKYDMTLREEFIESNRQTALDSVSLALNREPDLWSRDEVERLRYLINMRFDERMNALHEGRKVWDIAASMLMIARGYKPSKMV